MKSWLGESIGRACVKHDTALWGYVFMPEHVHLMVYPRLVDYDISEFLRSVKESTTRKAMAYRRSSERNESIWKPFLDVRPDGHVHFRLWQRVVADMTETLSRLTNSAKSSVICTIIRSLVDCVKRHLIGRGRALHFMSVVSLDLSR